jgi:hypothetical protein
MLDYLFVLLLLLNAIGIFIGMDCIDNIKKLAEGKLIEAECLFAHGHFDWSYYTSGYTVELLLKARVCKVLGD